MSHPVGDDEEEGGRGGGTGTAGQRPCGRGDYSCLDKRKENLGPGRVGHRIPLSGEPAEQRGNRKESRPPMVDVDPGVDTAVHVDVPDDADVFVHPGVVRNVRAQWHRPVEDDHGCREETGEQPRTRPPLAERGRVPDDHQSESGIPAHGQGWRQPVVTEGAQPDVAK